MKNLIVLLMMLGAVQGFAADGGSMPVDPPAKPTPEMVKVGDDYFLDIKDGRVAGISQTIGKVVRTRLGLRQIENTCDYDQVLSNCRLEIDLASRTLKVEWVKHPDPSKIGQVVSTFNRNQDGAIVGKTALMDDFGFVSWFETLSESTYAGKFKPDQLICDNFAWAKDIPVLNARMNIDAWASELMTETSETKMTENQTASVAFDVQLKKSSNTTFDFEKIGAYKGNSNLPPYFASQVASLTFVNKNKKQCQVSFEANIEEILALIRKPEFKVVDPSTRTTFRSATILQNSFLRFFLNYSTSSYAPEFE